jgi:diadenosine tetraphosphate (Ap4A) HIT family hydrolase
MNGHDESSPSSQCDFCNEFAGGTTNAFYARYAGTPPDRILLATENFRVFPSIGQLVEGHLLIAPVSHYTALDEMPKIRSSELIGIWRHVRSQLSELYSPCVCFEHGARGPLNGGCGIYHAHLHVAPLNGHPNPIDALKATFPYTQLTGLNEIWNHSVRLPSYLLYQDLDATLYLFDAGTLPSQYMRKLLADALQEQNWNWRTAGREERLLATMRRLLGQFDVPEALPAQRQIAISSKLL